MRVVLIVVLAFLGALGAGCASYTPAIAVDEKPTPNDAYLYGRFAMEAPKSFLGLDSHETMGFVIQCVNDQTYTLRFSNDKPLQAIKIAPGICSLTEFIYTDADGIIRTRKPALAGLMQNAKFGAGKAYYLGDYFAAVTRTHQLTRVHWQWNIKNVKNNYTPTTAEMKSKYSNLSSCIVDCYWAEETPCHVEALQHKPARIYRLRS